MCPTHSCGHARSQNTHIPKSESAAYVRGRESARGLEKDARPLQVRWISRLGEQRARSAQQWVPTRSCWSARSHETC